MNLHFERLKGTDKDPVPTHAYGRFDHVELSKDGRTALVAFDLVDIDWMTKMANEYEMFALDGREDQADMWRRFFQRQHSQHLHNPFEKMPIYRLEIDLPNSGYWFGLPTLENGPDLPKRLKALEESWVDFQFSLTKGGKASNPAATGQLYRRMFEESLDVIVTGKLLTGPVAQSLSTIFSLSNLPTISQGKFENFLNQKVLAEWLVVFDVGQGSACALLEASEQDTSIPRLYFDLGAGVYRNKDTTPIDLEFGFYGSPPVVLSHWDSDHWAGAYVANPDAKCPALELTWIAPLQTVGPTHIAFVNDVRNAGGEFLIYSHPNPQNVGVTSLRDGKVVRFMCGTGHGRNDTGLVMAIEKNDDEFPRSWILTGDCDYAHFMKKLTPLNPVVLVAPHHGANLSPNTPVALPDPQNPYRRLIYSFGKDNKHGKTHVQHPTTNGVNAHDPKKWDHHAWMLHKPGHPLLAQGDVRSTCEHSPGTDRGGILVGWVQPKNLIQVIGTSNRVVVSTTQT